MPRIKVKKTLPTTAKMVDAALIELHSYSGITLNKLSAFIMDKYAIEPTNRRMNLIRKRIRELQQSEDVFNKTGEGFRGRFKLANKHQFMKTIEEYSKRPRSIIVSNNDIKSKRKSNPSQSPVKKSKLDINTTVTQTPEFPVKQPQKEHDSSITQPSSTSAFGQTIFISPRSSLPAKMLNYIGKGRRLSFDE